MLLLYSDFMPVPFLQGMPGAPSMKMYSRDELMNTKNLGEEDDEEEDEDEDEDTHFPSKLVSRPSKKSFPFSFTRKTIFMLIVLNHLFPREKF